MYVCYVCVHMYVCMYVCVCTYVCMYISKVTGGYIVSKHVCVCVSERDGGTSV